MIFSRRWFTLLALAGVPLLFAGLWQGFAEVCVACYGVLIAFTWRDWRRIAPHKSLTVEREAEERYLLQAESEILLRVENKGASPVTLDIKDAPPAQWLTDHLEEGYRFTIAPSARHTLTYRVTPNERGDATFGDLAVRQHGAFGLVARQWTVSAPLAVRVYPNLFKDATLELTAHRGRLQMAGVRAMRIQGIGREFESLRDYQPDDEMRRIDWKATARRGKLISRQYETERSQNLFLLFDVGRTIVADIDGVPKLDYALNAGLLLAYVALQSEDRVGALVFSDRALLFVPPRRGHTQLELLHKSLYNIRATFQETDYRIARTELQSRWRKRSLVICFTDLWDSESSRYAIEEISALRAQHFVIAVSLLDTNLLRASQQPVTTPEEAFRVAAAVQVLEERAQALELLKRRGVFVIDTPAERLSAELIQRYLEVKERMLV